MLNLLAIRYAQALYDLCKEREMTDTVYKDVQKISRLIGDSVEFTKFLENPVISSKQKEKIFHTIFTAKISSLTYTFILFLDSKRRLSLLKSICDSFEDLYSKDKKIVKIAITSAMELTKHQIDLICQHLKKTLQKTIEPQIFIDSKMVGGFRVQIEDKIYDYSVRTQLAKFKEGLVSA